MKHALYALFVLLVLFALLVPAQSASAQSGCYVVNHTVGRVYLRNGTSRVQRLSDIAARYHTSANDIAQRNGLPSGARLMIGQSLSVLRCPAVATPVAIPRPTPVYTGNPCRLIGLCS